MTGLEPATSGVTGRCSNQLSYIPKSCGISSYVDSSGRWVSGVSPSRAVLSPILCQPCQSPDCNRRCVGVQGIVSTTASRDMNGYSRNGDEAGLEECHGNHLTRAVDRVHELYNGNNPAARYVRDDGQEPVDLAHRSTYLQETLENGIGHREPA
jgi:hypothetical protein